MCIYAKLTQTIQMDEQTHHTDDNSYCDTRYWIDTGVQCIKEFTAVLIFMVAYSRTDTLDTLASPLTLYMVLTVMSFPFLNSYIFFVMRFGPWWKKGWNRYWIMRTVKQFMLITGFQIAGAAAAHSLVSKYEDVWKGAKPAYMLNTTEIRGFAYDNSKPSLNITSKAEKLLLEYNAVSDEGKEANRAGFFFEDFTAVSFLLIGTLHLMEAITPKILPSAFWYTDGNVNADYVMSNGTGLSSRHRDLHLQMEKILKNVERLEKKIDKMQSHETEQKESKTKPGGDTPPTLTGTTAVPQNEPKPSIEAYTPIPFMLIMQLSLLLLAVTRAFPSAHLSPHISVYDGLDTGEWVRAGCRMGGGFTASMAVLVYYKYVYMCSGEQDPSKSKTAPHAVRLHPFFRSELLQVPLAMVVVPHGGGGELMDGGRGRRPHLG
jgi:hypothetical protein